MLHWMENRKEHDLRLDYYFNGLLMTAKLNDRLFSTRCLAEKEESFFEGERDPPALIYFYGLWACFVQVHRESGWIPATEGHPRNSG